jgi:hypothetical protein
MLLQNNSAASSLYTSEPIAELLFLVSYIAPNLEAQVKRSVNQDLQSRLQALSDALPFQKEHWESNNGRSNRTRKTVCVVSGHWDGKHVVYINFRAAVAALANDYDVSPFPIV